MSCELSGAMVWSFPRPRFPFVIDWCAKESFLQACSFLRVLQAEEDSFKEGRKQETRLVASLCKLSLFFGIFVLNMSCVDGSILKENIFEECQRKSLFKKIRNQLVKNVLFSIEIPNLSAHYLFKILMAPVAPDTPLVPTHPVGPAAGAVGVPTPVPAAPVS